jgi:hypothetical protein
MLISGNIAYKRAICLTEDILRKMETLLLKYFDTVTYFCSLVNNDYVVFYSLKELLTYDNHSNGKIQYLSIVAKTNNESKHKCNLDFFPKPSFLNSNDTTMSGFVDLENQDDIIFIKNKINYILNSSEISTCYTILTKLSVAYVVLGYLIIKAILYMVSFGKEDKSAAIDLTFNNIFYPTLIAFMISFIIYFIFKKIWGYLFPPITYKWGAQIFEANKKSNLRQQILWGIIVSLLVSLVGSFIWSKI